MTTALEHARSYVARGFAPIPVPHGRKYPNLTGWQAMRLATGDELAAHFNGAPQNIGILNGAPSTGQVDLDLDAPEVAAFRSWLPDTGMVFGRPGNPSSHHIYRCPDVVTTKYLDPCRADGDNRQTLLELRATGTQTLFPPSTHPSGEVYQFDRDGEPALVDAPMLRRILGRVAAAALLARYWPGKGSRHDAALALSGMLLRGAMDESEVRPFVAAIARAAGDEEWAQREKNVASTARRLTNDGKATGAPRLAELLDGDGAKIVARVREWLGLHTHTADANVAIVAIETPMPNFPLDVFPSAVRRYVADSAAALGVAPDLIAVPLLAMAGGAIGNTRALLVKPGWIERPILWAAVIALPGSGKSPALTVARQPLDTLQGTSWARYREALARWEAEVAAAKVEKRRDELARPELEHYFTVDATVEALSRILAGSAGVVLVRDELAGWVKSHDAYRKGGDRESFLSLWAGQALKVDRRGAEPLFVPRPVLCVAGGIQPDRLPELRGDGEALDGFLDRFLFAYPETRPHLWTEATPDPTDRATVERLFARLRAGGAEDGHLIRLSSEARRVFATWYDENARHIAAARGLAAGFAAKFPGQLARLTLILHTLNRPDDLRGEVPRETVEDGIALVEYFAAHLARVLPAFGASARPREAGLKGRVARLLDRTVGNWVDRTALSEGLGGREKSEEIAAALEELRAEGRAEPRTVPTGRRPREEWRSRRYGDMETVIAS